MQQRSLETQEILQTLPRGPAVDIGFGAGESLEVLVREGFTPLVGYELDACAFEQGRRRMEALGMPCQLWMKDATSLQELPDYSLALIHGRSVFQYFRFYALANSVGRKLRVGGHLVFMVPSLQYYLRWRSYLPGIKSFAMWRLVSYPRAICRTMLLIASGLQPKLGGSAPEIGWTSGLVRRFARCAGLETAILRRRGWMLEVILRKDM